MNIGDLVWNKYHSMLRFGTIQEKRIDENGWLYFKVNWHADEIYERSMENRKMLCNRDYTLKEYRKDQIKPISVGILSKVLEEHRNEF